MPNARTHKRADAPFRQVPQEVLVGRVVQSAERSVVHREAPVVHRDRPSGGGAPLRRRLAAARQNPRARTAYPAPHTSPSHTQDLSTQSDCSTYSIATHSSAPSAKVPLTLSRHERAAFQHNVASLLFSALLSLLHASVLCSRSFFCFLRRHHSAHCWQGRGGGGHQPPSPGSFLGEEY